MDITKASAQWSTRPSDEAFWGLADAKIAAQAHKASAVEFERPWSDLRVEANGPEVALVGKAGIPAALTHYAFGQLAARAAFPADPLRRLPATLACQVLNHQIKNTIDQNATAAMMAHRNGSMLVRCITSEKYSRFWNADLLDLLDRRLSPLGWRTPPARPSPARSDDPRIRPATKEDMIDWGATGGGAAIQEGELVGPAGVYASDHDCFVLLVLPGRSIEVPGSTLNKFLLLWNSEVGDRALGGMTGYLDMVCGNHILWGAREVVDFSIRHVGEVERRFEHVSMSLRRYADASVSEDQAKIVAAQTRMLGATKVEVLEAMLGLNAKKKLGLSQTITEEAYDAAERTPRYGDPKSVWGMVNGLTEVSQRLPYQEARVKVDQAAGRLMDVAF